MKKCPYCDELIEDNSIKCIYCSEKLKDNILEEKTENKNIKVSIYQNQIGKILTIEGKNKVKGEFKINIPKNVKVGDIFEVDGVKFEIENIKQDNKNFKGVIFTIFLILFFTIWNIYNKNINNNKYITSNYSYTDKDFNIISKNTEQNRKYILEFNEKRIKTYYSKSNDKAMGVDISIDYPGSWDIQYGKRPHVLSLIGSPYENGIINSLTILVSKNEQKLNNNDLISVYNYNSFEKIEGQKQIDTGIITIENQPFIWQYLESEDIERVGKKIKGHTLFFYTIVNGEILNIQLATVGDELNSGEIKEEFLGNIELYRLIMNSIVINNNY